MHTKPFQPTHKILSDLRGFSKWYTFDVAFSNGYWIPKDRWNDYNAHDGYKVYKYRDNMLVYTDADDYYERAGWLRPIDCECADVLNASKASKIYDLEHSLHCAHLTAKEEDFEPELVELLSKALNMLTERNLNATILLQKYCKDVEV